MTTPMTTPITRSGTSIGVPRAGSSLRPEGQLPGSHLKSTAFRLGGAAAIGAALGGSIGATVTLFLVAPLWPIVAAIGAIAGALLGLTVVTYAIMRSRQAPLPPPPLSEGALLHNPSNQAEQQHAQNEHRVDAECGRVDATTPSEGYHAADLETALKRLEAMVRQLTDMPVKIADDHLEIIIRTEIAEFLVHRLALTPTESLQNMLTQAVAKANEVLNQFERSQISCSTDDLQQMASSICATKRPPEGPLCCPNRTSARSWFRTLPRGQEPRLPGATAPWREEFEGTLLPQLF